MDTEEQVKRLDQLRALTTSPRPHGMSKSDLREQRNAAIIALGEAGVPQADIAHAADLSRKQVRDIQAAGGLPPRPPGGVAPRASDTPTDTPPTT